MPPTQIKHKDKLFVRLFSEPVAALSLFNALNNTKYNDASNLKIITLEDALYVGWKNDVAVLCHNELQLYEQQSTQNPNMPLRDFIYSAHEYEGFIKSEKLDIYGKKLVKIPTPKCITLYNGVETKPEYSIGRLSDAFINKTSGYEWTVYFYNINQGYNSSLLDSCQTLKGYSIFIDKIRQNHKDGLSIEEAIKISSNYCISHNYLKDFLLKHSGEALNMILSLYDEELHKKTLREEGREEGRKEGHKDLILNMLKNGLSLELVAKIAKTSVADIIALQESNSQKSLSSF